MMFFFHYSFRALVFKGGMNVALEFLSEKNKLRSIFCHQVHAKAQDLDVKQIFLTPKLVIKQTQRAKPDYR